MAAAAAAYATPTSLSGDTPQAAATSRYTGIGTTPHIDAEVDDKIIRERLFGTPYEPNEALWGADQRRWVANLPSGEREKEAYATLKARGLPLLVNGPTVWNGRALQNEPEKWLYVFTPEQKAEVEQAVKYFTSLPEARAKEPYDFDLINEKTFPLPSLGPVLHQAADDILNGVGIRVFRGLEPQNWDRVTQIIAYTGISSYIGSTRLKQHDRRALIHLRDITRVKKEERPVIALKGTFVIFVQGGGWGLGKQRKKNRFGRGGAVGGSMYRTPRPDERTNSRLSSFCSFCSVCFPSGDKDKRAATKSLIRMQGTLSACSRSPLLPKVGCRSCPASAGCTTGLRRTARTFWPS